MRSINEFKLMIEEAMPCCPECDEPFSEWLDAEPTEKVIYVGPDALFVGLCSKGHFAEMHLAELKAGVVIAHLRTERTLGRAVKQTECSHSRKLLMDFEGTDSPGLEETIHGPCKIMWCWYCSARWPAPPEEPPKKKSRLILPPGV